MCSLTVLEVRDSDRARGPEGRVSVEQVPPGGSGRPAACLFLPLEVGPPCSAPASGVVVACPSTDTEPPAPPGPPSYEDLVITLGPPG